MMDRKHAAWMAQALKHALDGYPAYDAFGFIDLDHVLVVKRYGEREWSKIARYQPDKPWVHLDEKQP